MLNLTVITGRLTRDPELRTTKTGTPVASFTLAVERDIKPKDGGERGVDFLDCVAWQHTAEFVDRYFNKGSLATVKGRIQVREYRNKDDKKVRVYEIVADSVYFGESKRDDTVTRTVTGETYSQPAPSDFAELDMDDGDLPF